MIAVARNSDPATSHKAAERVTQHLTEIQKRVLAAFRALGSRPITDEDLVIQLPELAPSTVRSRRAELVRMGKIRDSGRTVRNSRGHEVTVWELVKL